MFNCNVDTKAVSFLLSAMAYDNFIVVRDYFDDN